MRRIQKTLFSFLLIVFTIFVMLNHVFATSVSQIVGSEILIQAEDIDVGNVEVSLTVTNLTNGLSGFIIDVFSSNTSTIEIINASIDPTNFPLSVVDIIGPEQVNLSGVDLLNSISSTTISVKLANISLRAINPGTSTIFIATTRVDDDDGFHITTFSEDLIIEVTESLFCLIVNN